jgi:hypothetical protein
VTNTPLPADVEPVTVGSRVLPEQKTEGDLLLESSTSQSEGCYPVVAGFCEEKHRLVDELLHAIRELNALLEEQTRALTTGDSDFSRFDLLIHAARQKKDSAKYAWMAHVETHHCEGA